jgi:hypothetical protein
MIYGRSDRLLSIKLRIDPEDSDMAALVDLPWESLYDPVGQQFLTLSDDHCVVRDLLAPVRRRKLQFPALLRILVVACSPADLPMLDLKAELEKIERASRGRLRITVTFLEEATPEKLRKALESGKFHVLHFMGHGFWSDGVGKLAFQKADGTQELISGLDLADMVSRCVTLQLIVLNACSGGQFQAGQNPFTGVATALILRGFPAVIAMRSKISDRAAIEFSGALHEFLALGYPVERAVTEGRRKIQQIPSTEWKVPTLYLRTGSSWVKSWRNAALTFMVLLTFTTAAWLFDHLHPSGEVVRIDLQDGAMVAPDVTITGTISDPRLLYYVVVKDPQGKCWPQSDGPLLPSADGRWSAMARFSGNPGQRYELIVMASSHSLPKNSLESCGDSVKGLQRYVKRVRVGPNRESDSDQLEGRPVN